MIIQSAVIDVKGGKPCLMSALQMLCSNITKCFVVTLQNACNNITDNL